MNTTNKNKKYYPYKLNHITNSSDLREQRLVGNQ